MYQYYDPNQAKMDAMARRDAAMQRLMTIMDQRQQATDLERVKMEKEIAQQQAAQKQSQWDGMGSMYGSAAQGAMTGTAFGGLGVGTAVGAGAGLLLGGIAEAKNRKDFKQANGESGYGWWDAIGDTVGRAPNLSEVGSIGMAGAGIGAGVAGQQSAMNDGMARAKATQAKELAAWRASQPLEVVPGTPAPTSTPAPAPTGTAGAYGSALTKQPDLEEPLPSGFGRSVNYNR
jgi:hypothetical protein